MCECLSMVMCNCAFDTAGAEWPHIWYVGAHPVQSSHVSCSIKISRSGADGALNDAWRTSLGGEGPQHTAVVCTGGHVVG